MKCHKCNKEIKNGDTYVELQVWEMKDYEGDECGDHRLCEDCYDDVADFISGN